MNSPLCVIFILIIAYFVISYFLLEQKLRNMNKKLNNLYGALDQRFKIFEDYIAILTEHKINYEQTFLKEIVQLRVQAQKSKSEQDIRTEFFFEEKISKISSKIEFLLENSSLLLSIKETEDIKQNILQKEEKLNQLKNEYNNALISYNKMRSLPIFIIVTTVISRFNSKNEFWNIH